MIRVIGFFLLAVPLLSKAHPVSLSWANARMYQDKISINFKILAEDLIYFHHPEHDESYNYDVDELKKLAIDHGQLIRKYFYIVDDNDKILASKIVSVNDKSLSSNEINVMDLMKYEILIGLEFTLDVNNWKKLVFYQEFGSIGIGIPSVTFLSVYRKNEALVENAEVSPGNPFVLRPEPHRLNQDPSELTSSFFTFTLSGIRHELTLPTSIFNNLIDQRLSEMSLTQKISEYFNKYNAVFGNNVRLVPELQHIKSLDELEEGSLIPLDGLVYLDIFYPAEHALQNSKLTWTDYSWKLRWFKAEIVAIDSSYHHTFSRFQPEFIWEPKVSGLKLKNK